MEKYYPILNNCALFRQIEEVDLGNLLKCLGAQVKKYQAEDYVFIAGDEVNYVGIILVGIVEILKENLAGNKHIVAFLGPSHMFAEGIVCTDKRISPVTVRIKETAEILWIPYERVVKSCGNSCTFHVRLIQNMMMVLGEKNLTLNKKLELLTLKGMREKIASYLLNEAAEQSSHTFQIMLNRTELADYLNVSRTSMCRELTRMKDEGLLDFYGSSFKLLDMDHLVGCLE